jgi:hypothetical protein
VLRLLGLIAGWAVATAVVVALGWAAVGAVAGAVTDPPVLAQPPVAPGAVADRPTDPGTRTFDLASGRVGVRASAEAVELVFATPNDGFSVDVRSRGPARVDVRFSSDDHESRFRYEPGAGERVEERPD